MGPARAGQAHKNSAAQKGQREGDRHAQRAAGVRRGCVCLQGWRALRWPVRFAAFRGKASGCAWQRIDELSGHAACGDRIEGRMQELVLVPPVGNLICQHGILAKLVVEKPDAGPIQFAIQVGDQIMRGDRMMRAAHFTTRRWREVVPDETRCVDASWFAPSRDARANLKAVPICAEMRWRA